MLLLEKGGKEEEMEKEKCREEGEGISEGGGHRDESDYVGEGVALEEEENQEEMEKVLLTEEGKEMVGGV